MTTDDFPPLAPTWGVAWPTHATPKTDSQRDSDIASNEPDIKFMEDSGRRPDDDPRGLLYNHSQDDVSEFIIADRDLFAEVGPDA